MAVVEKVGFDRRGVTIYEQHPNGEDQIEEYTDIEKIRIGGKIIERTFNRSRKKVNNDLPKIAQAYEEFLLDGKGVTR